MPHEVITFGEAMIRLSPPNFRRLEQARSLDVQAGGAELKWKTTEQGAATSVLVATSPLLAGVGGRYFEDCNEAGRNQPGTRRGVAAYALDPEAAARLWQVSLAMLAL